MWCGVIMTRRGADRQSVCYYVTSLHQPLSVSSVFVQVRLQAVLLMCSIIIIITITNTMLYVAQTKPLLRYPRPHHAKLFLHPPVNIAVPAPDIQTQLHQPNISHLHI